MKDKLTWFLSLAFSMLLCTPELVCASSDMEGQHGLLQCDACHVQIPIAGQAVEDSSFVTGSKDSLCRSCHQIAHTTTFRSLAMQSATSAEWRYTAMNNGGCNCHSLKSGDYYPNSHYIKYGWGLADFQMCKNCHTSNPYSGSTQPFTIVSKGYDFGWPVTDNHRIFLHELKNEIAAGRISFTASIFSPENIPLPAGFPDPRVSCRDVSPGYAVVLNYRNLHNPAVSGILTFDNLWTFSYLNLVWPLTGLPGGRYQVTLTPYHQNSAGVPFVVQVDIPDFCDLRIASFTSDRTGIDPEAGEQATFSATIQSSQSVSWNIDVISQVPNNPYLGGVARTYFGAGIDLGGVSWNGRDSAGSVVPTGTYLVRLTADSGMGCTSTASPILLSVPGITPADSRSYGYKSV